MKILIVVPDTNIGGITTSVYNFSGELEKRGHNITFLDFSAREKKETLNKSINQIFLKGRAKYWQLGAKQIKSASIINRPFLLVLGMFKKLTIKSGVWDRFIFKKLKDEYDVAVAFRQCAPCYSFVLNKVNAKKKIGFVHGDVDFMGDISSWQPFMKKFDKIAYVSNSAKTNFISKHPELKDNAITIYNMFDFCEMQKKAEEKLPLDMDKDKFNIVTVARIDNSSKQIHWLPEICGILKQETSKPFHWFVLGDGPDLQDVMQKNKDLGTQDVLTFLGAVSNPYSIIKNSDLGVLTSKTEGYCMAVIEQLSLILPLVATNFQSITEQMSHKKEGLIAQMNVESVAENILFMLENQDGIYSVCKDELNKKRFSNDLAYEQFINAVQ